MIPSYVQIVPRLWAEVCLHPAFGIIGLYHHHLLTVANQKRPKQQPTLAKTFMTTHAIFVRLYLI